MSAIKEEAIRLIQSLPDDCSIEDIQYHLYVQQKVENGLAAVEAGRCVNQEELTMVHASRDLSGFSPPDELAGE